MTRDFPYDVYLRHPSPLPLTSIRRMVRETGLHASMLQRIVKTNKPSTLFLSVCGTTYGLTLDQMATIAAKPAPVLPSSLTLQQQTELARSVSDARDFLASIEGKPWLLRVPPTSDPHSLYLDPGADADPRPADPFGVPEQRQQMADVLQWWEWRQKWHKRPNLDTRRRGEVAPLAQARAALELPIAPLKNAMEVSSARAEYLTAAYEQHPPNDPRILDWPAWLELEDTPALVYAAGPKVKAPKSAKPKAPKSKGTKEARKAKNTHKEK